METPREPHQHAAPRPHARLVVAALALRLPSIGTRSLWLDEAWLANAALGADPASPGQPAASVLAPVPPLFFLLLRPIAAGVGRSPGGLRALPLLDRLVQQRRASPHTIAAYRHTFRLLLRFAATRLSRPASALVLADIDAPFVSAFLDHLERERGKAARSRNARLAAPHAFFRYVAFAEPAYALYCQRVLALPSKRFERGLVEFLGEEEVAALLAVPDPATWIGRRGRTLLPVAIQTGLRVSELIALRRQDVTFGSGAHVRCLGKGGSCAVRRCTATSPGSLRPGCANGRRNPTRRSSPVPAGDASATMRLSVSWPSTPPRRNQAAVPSRPSASPRIRCAIPPRCGCSSTAWTAA
jgi:hypothetical protein